MLVLILKYIISPMLKSTTESSLLEILWSLSENSLWLNIVYHLCKFLTYLRSNEFRAILAQCGHKKTTTVLSPFLPVYGGKRVSSNTSLMHFFVITLISFMTRYISRDYFYKYLIVIGIYYITNNYFYKILFLLQAYCA